MSPFYNSLKPQTTCVPESPDSHHVHCTTSCENQIIYLSSSHPPEQWFFHIQGSCIATSFFHQPVIFQRYPLLLFRPKSVKRSVLSSQHPGLSNIVSDYCLLILIAFSCCGTFRGLATAWFLSLVIVFLFPFSKANYKDLPHVTFLFW